MRKIRHGLGYLLGLGGIFMVLGVNCWHVVYTPELTSAQMLVKFFWLYLAAIGMSLVGIKLLSSESESS